jgi:serine/threonine protein kinase
MDKLKALQYEKQLKGQSLAGYKLIEFRGNGKSAAVFKAEKDGQIFALKIFDNEFIERFGYEIQTKRIEQEISLKGHSISNLIRIFEGGSTSIEGQDFYYIVMEFIEGENLKDYLRKRNYGQGFILKVLNTLNKVTEELLVQRRIAHRDIKPENIMVDPSENIILMDLGVLKLIGAKSMSDEEEKSFVGTLRYAPPEFLRRTEEDSENGWRAINFYQIGATLHDLIMKEELFHDKNPYPNLVIAIKDDMPKISNNSLSFELLQLTRDMLTKDWKKRLELINTERITRTIFLPKATESLFDKNIEEIFKIRAEPQAKFEEIEKLQRTKEELRIKKIKIGKILTQTIDQCFNYLCEKNICSKVDKSENFNFNNDDPRTGKLIQNYLYELHGTLAMGFLRHLFILVKLTNDETNYTEIDIWGVFPGISTKASINEPHITIQQVLSENERYNSRTLSYPKTINIFKGIADLDTSFSEYIKTQVSRLIVNALKSVETNVQEELKWHEQEIKSTTKIFTREGRSRSIIIDKI